MRRGLSALAHLSAAVLLLAATGANATQVLVGSINAVFADRTDVHLQLSAPGMIETGNVALLPLQPGSPSFTMTADFLGANAPHSYSDLIILASLDPSFDNSALSITLGGETIAANDFVDAAAFGIPFPPNGINGIGNGAGDYLSLNGAVVAAWELDTPLVRPDGVDIDVMLTGYTGSLDQKIRFDVFALEEVANSTSTQSQGLGRPGSSPVGPATIQRTIVANNPNSGALGVIPEPTAAIVFAVGAVVVGGASLRMRRA